MNVILTPVGSAGDVNPFIVIGRELRRRGHRVTLIGPEPFATVTAAAGLGFLPVGTAEDYERATKDPDLWHPRRGINVVAREIIPHLARAYAAVEELYVPNETMIVEHPLALFSRTFEERHNVPAVTLQLAPSVFRSDAALPVLPSGQDISGWPRWAKRLFWWAVDRFGIDPVIAPGRNAWRATLGMPPVSRVFKDWFNSPQRIIGLFPDWFGDPQPDWPPQLRLTGFVLSDASCAPIDEPRAAAMPSMTR